MPSKKHRHEFFALYWHFGPYGRQNVHVHSCMDSDCDRLVIGEGRTCDKRNKHWRETLTDVV